MTPAQSRAARALLVWTQVKLADAAGVSGVTIRDFENGKTVPRRASLRAMQSALEEAGVEFVGEHGVSLRKAKLAATAR